MPQPPTVQRRALLSGAAGAALMAAAPALRAQASIAGGKPISLIVSYPAGGGADLMARLIAGPLSRLLGQSVVVENKPGASGQLAAAQVARATPDGSTLLLDASSFAVNPSLFAKLPYDSDKAFVPLAVLATFPNVLVAHPGFAARSVKEVVAAARQQPGKVAYASSGNGSAQHLAGALFEDRAGVSMLHVPYRGGGPALNDVIGGQVPLFFANVASSQQHIQAGRLRPLGVTSRRRARSLPEVPTMEESGLRDFEVVEWNPVLAPAGLAPELAARLRGAIRQAMDDVEVLGRVRSLSGEVFADSSAQAAAAFIAAQRTQWARVIRERRITVE